jgi:hypothetical protein
MFSALLCLAGCLLLAWPLAGASPGVRAEFIGGTLSTIAAKTDGRLDVTGAEVLLYRAGRVEVQIDYRRVHTIE